jgi:NAD(P)-dependent dehydrogenase (short-subunit alcohol dehydrogenase family)
MSSDCRSRNCGRGFYRVCRAASARSALTQSPTPRGNGSGLSLSAGDRSLALQLANTREMSAKDHSMKGKIVVATGATSGIGEAAVLELAGMGARVAIVGRDQRRAQATMRKLEAKAPGLGHRVHLADLTSMAETRRVGAAIIASEPRIDVLINNAGAIFAKRRLTAEGLEMTFALNHMAYFVLTDALSGTLVASAPARIVSTASDAHQNPSAGLDFNDLQSAKGYNAFNPLGRSKLADVYGRSKLANVLFTRELARRLAGTGVTVNCLHPGFVATRIGRSAGGWASLVIPLVQAALALPPQQGADTIVYLASSPDVETITGEYFVKRKVTEPSPAARDDVAAKRLWEASEKLAGLAQLGRTGRRAV